MACDENVQSQQWSKSADSYAAVAPRITNPMADAALARHTEHWASFPPSGEDGSINFLDVAAGTGYFSGILAGELRKGGRRFSILCTDFAQGMVELAAKNNQDPAVKCVQMDGQDLSSVADASVDGLCCMFGIMYMPDYRKAIREMKRVLKPGALATVGTWLNPGLLPLGDSFGVFLGALAPGEVSPGTQENLIGKDAEALGSLFKTAGFSKVDVVKVPKELYFTELDDLYTVMVKNPILVQSIKSKRPGAIEPTFELFQQFLLESPLAQEYRRTDGQPGCKFTPICHLVLGVA